MPNAAEQIAQLQSENEFLRRENVLLRQKVDLLVRRIFGAGSEKLDGHSWSCY